MLRRREFLRGLLAAGLSSALPLRAEEASSRVLVVGAGMAGLACARKLAREGFQVTVLEGSQHVGGRVWTDRSFGTPLELGAGWIHGPRANPIAELARQAGARTVASPDLSTVVFSPTGQKLDYPEVDRHRDTILEILDRAHEGPANLTARQVLEQANPRILTDPIYRYQLASDIEFDYGAPLDKLSARFMDGGDEHYDEDVFLPDGYDQLPRFLARGLTLKLGHTVTAIEHGGREVLAQTARGAFAADYVVVTVPLGALKKGLIRFAPALPQRLVDSVRKLGMGLVNRVSLQFEAPFWDPKIPFYGFCTPKLGMYPYFVCKPSASVLTTFATGAYAHEHEQMTNAEIQKKVLEVLRIGFGKKVPTPKRMLTTRWGRDPLTYGAYSYGAFGSTIDDYREFTRPVNDQLFFAGEHTIGKYRATVHGAYMSGERAADQIIEVDGE